MRHITYILRVLFMCMAFPLSASAKFEVDGIYYNILSESDLTCEVTSPKGSNTYSGKIILPQSIAYNGKTYSVTEIGDYAFSGCKELTSLTIPDGITHINKYSFNGCSGLTSLIIPGSVNKIGKCAFLNCTGFTTLNIPEGVTIIGVETFNGCSGLTNLSIPSSVEQIGICAFANCHKDLKVIVAGGNKTFSVEGSALFSKDKTKLLSYFGLSESYNIPSTVTSIEGAFYKCANIQTINIPNSVKNIGTNAFAYCTALKSLIIPNSVTLIGAGAFSYCEGLSQVNIPNSITHIGSGAFSNCINILSLIIPNSVTNIGCGAFRSCYNLKTVEFNATNCTYDDGEDSNYLHGAFNGCTNLSSVIIGENVTNIPFAFFYRCYGLTSVEFSNSVTSISGQAFRECRNLTTLILPKSLTSIGYCSFYGCSGLKRLTIPSRIKTIDALAFFDCAGLTNLTIENTNPSSIKMGYNVFYNASTNCMLYVPKGSKSSYTKAEQWKDFSKIIEMSSNIEVSSLTLSFSELTLKKGETYILIATIKPDNADDKIINWESSNKSVATVDADGNVTAIGVGSATITAAANDNSGVSASCVVTVKKLNESFNPEYVDLGLPSGLLWATCNVGATKPEEYGSYFRWGETDEYDSSKEYLLDELNDFGLRAEGYINGNNALNPEYDAATANWGEPWRMPTKTEYEELITSCSSVWTTLNGITGRKLIGPNGNSIFFPAAGYCYSKINQYGLGKYGFYWPSTILGELDFSANDIEYYSGEESEHEDGQSVRPVRSSNVLVSQITLSSTDISLKKGDTQILTAQVLPENATDKTITWSSNKPSIATIDSNGNITAVGAGTATITATTNDDSGVSASCKVTVTVPTCATPTFSQNGDKLTISCATSDATIYYTIGGATPTNASIKYTGPIIITDNRTIKAIAYATNFNASAVASYTPNSATCQQVSISVSGTTATLTCTTSGATIYYTLDGTTPTTSSSKYTSPITLTRNCTIKAVAIKAYMNDSEVASYNVNTFTVATPSFSQSGDRLTISCATDGATIYYTIGGAEPTNASTKYTGPISIADNRMIKAIAYKEGYNTSAVASYSPNSATCSEVSIVVNGTTATLTCATDGATIHYTLDGTNPTASSSVYTSPITLTRNCTIKAIAMKENMNDSPISSYSVCTFTTSTPTFSMNGDKLTICCATNGATIYYTIGGAEPTNVSTRYTGPITISDNRMVKAIAYTDGFNPSSVASYTPNSAACQKVAISVSGTKATLTCATSGATIYYTLDGTTPTASSSVYSSPITLTHNCTIKAVAMKENLNDSEVTSYNVSSFRCSDVTMSYDGRMVSLSSGTDGAVIYYTIDGSTPTAASAVYTKPFDAGGIVTVKAIATKVNWNDSEVMEEKLPCYSDGRVAWVDESAALDKALSVGTEKLAAVVWNVNAAVPSNALAGIDNPNLLLYVKMRSYGLVGINNVVVDNQAERIELADDGCFFVPIAFTAKRISYTHCYRMSTPTDGSAAGWETLALPFDVQSITHESHGAAAPFATNVAGTKPFWLYTLGENGWVKATGIKANTPYIICMPNNEAYADDYILAGDVTFSAENANVPTTNANIAQSGDKRFVPTTMAVGKSTNVFVINRNEKCSGTEPGSMFVSDLRTASPFEAYITVANTARAPHALSIFDLGRNNIATDILAIPTKAAGGGNIYTLTGVLVGRDGQTTGLASGIYIVNGKKKFVK